MFDDLKYNESVEIFNISWNQLSNPLELTPAIIDAFKDHSSMRLLDVTYNGFLEIHRERMEQMERALPHVIIKYEERG